MGQTGVLRACFATRPFRGLGFVEASTRRFHQGWKVTVLSKKAEYMSATEPHLVLFTITLQRRGGPYMSQSFRAILYIGIYSDFRLNEEAN
jgi:hypothetical protein